MYIGCHLSASKGYYAMGKQALELGANTFAFFTRNPRGGTSKKINEDDIKRFKKLAEINNFGKLVAHAPYTLNACSADEKIRTFALNTFKDDLRIMEYTPNQYYNFHPGNHLKQGVEVGIEYIAAMLNESLTEDQTTTVLLETMAGKGTEIGRNFQEIRAIIDKVQLKDKVGVCFDTCHVWDGGYDIVSDLDGVLDEFDKVIGIDYLKAVHLNDSKNRYNTHKDRHEKIGEGHIGLEAIANVVNNERLRDKPFILETPNDSEGYIKEIALIKNLRMK
jgi:deoxyribonuclease-4